MATYPSPPAYVYVPVTTYAQVADPQPTTDDPPCETCFRGGANEYGATCEDCNRGGDPVAYQRRGGQQDAGFDKTFP